MIDGKKCFDQPVKNDSRTYDRDVEKGRGRQPPPPPPYHFLEQNFFPRKIRKHRMLTCE